MKKLGVIRFLLFLLIVGAPIGAYVMGRNAVCLGEFKQYQGNLLTLTQWETNHSPELKEFVKAHYYHLANQIPKSWVGRPHDYGAVSSNLVHLTGFKGPTSARKSIASSLNVSQANSQNHETSVGLASPTPEPAEKSYCPTSVVCSGVEGAVCGIWGGDGCSAFR